MKAFENKAALKELCLELTKQSELLKQFASLSIAEKSLQAQIDLRRLSGFEECTRFEHELAIPAQLLYVAHKLSGNLPANLAASWSYEFFSSIRVGADLQRVIPQLAAWLLTDLEYGAIAHAASDDTRRAIREIAQLCVAKGKTAIDWRNALEKFSAVSRLNSAEITFEITRAVGWAIFSANAAQRAENLAGAVDRILFARTGAVPSFKDHLSIRTALVTKQTGKLLELLRAA